MDNTVVKDGSQAKVTLPGLWLSPGLSTLLRTSVDNRMLCMAVSLIPSQEFPYICFIGGGRTSEFPL